MVREYQKVVHDSHRDPHPLLVIGGEDIRGPLAAGPRVTADLDDDIEDFTRHSADKQGPRQVRYGDMQRAFDHGIVDVRIRLSGHVPSAEPGP